jgi:hypothetical protein
MLAPQAQRGTPPSISPLVSTRTEQRHSALVQCQRSPDFMTMAKYLLRKNGWDARKDNAMLMLIYCSQ